MPACPSCGRDNPDDARFCLSCGASIAAPAPEVRKTVSVVFADVTGSTGLGERFDPEAMRRVMSRWFDEARAALELHGGTVEKFIGDAVMAVFGIPQLHEDDALRAVRAAVEMRERLETVNGREAVEAVDRMEMPLHRADARVHLAETLRLLGREREGVPALEEALALQKAKGHLVAADRMRRLLDELAAEPLPQPK